MMTRRFPSREWLIFLLLLLFGVFLRFHALDRQSLWDDEMSTVRTISLPYRPLLNRFETHEAHPPLYFLQLHAWRALHLRSLVQLRANSALWGVISLILVFLLARRYGGDTVGLAAMAFLTLSPLHLAYSQEIRPYAMAMAIGLASLEMLERWLENKQRTTLMVLGALWTALLYTHYWGSFVVLALALYGYVRAPTAIARKAVAVTFCLASGLFLLWTPVLLAQVGLVGSLNFWASSFSPANLARTFAALSGLFFNMASSIFYLPTRVGVLACIGLCFAIALGVGLRRGPLAAKLWLIVGLGTPWLLSLWKPGLYVWYRYPTLMLPAFAILIAAGAMALRPKVLRFLILGICLGSQAWGSWVYFTTFEKANPKAVARYVLGLRKPDTIVVPPAYFGDLFQFYTGGILPTIDQHLLDSDDRRIALKGKNIIWVAFDVPSDPITEAMLQEFKVVSVRHFPGYAHLGITVYELK